MFANVKRFLKKNPVVHWLAAGLIAVLAFGLVLQVAGIPATPVDFRVGGLDQADGSYIISAGSIYTPKAFSLTGLVIEPDFKSDVTYSLYFYDDNGNFVSSLLKQRGKFVADIYNETTDYYSATECRIVITPDDDDYISGLEIVKYASQVSIKNK